MRSQARIAAAVGCSEPAQRVRVVDVPDGTYLRGEQVARLDVDPTLEVVSAELYLDGLRVAADEFAPFELAWDTRGFADGPHRLIARVYLQFETGVVEVYAQTRGLMLRHMQTLSDVGRFDTGSFGAFAGGGAVHYPSGTVPAPFDPIDDSVDRDCNERD